MQMKPVKSSNISSIGYDEANKTMRIKFSSGHEHNYSNVSPEKHAAFLAAPSIGKHFHAHFRNNPDHPAAEHVEEKA